MAERPLWRTILTPRWSGLLLLALAIAGVMSVMGVWQLNVYQSKTDAATAKRVEAAAVPLQSLFSIDEGLPSQGRRATRDAPGHVGASRRIRYSLLTACQGSQNGFWVASPVMLEATGSAGAVMVVRGWVPAVSDPAAVAPTGPVRLTGTVVASEAEDSSDDAAKGRVLSSLRIPTIVHLVDYRLYDAFVIQSSVDSGVVPSPEPAVVQPPSPPTDHAGLRNVAYAFQWWVFAAFTLWMWARMVLDARRSDPDSTEALPVDDQADAPVESSGTVSA